MEPEPGSKKAIPTISLDARMLYERLKKAAIGDVISYAELSAIVGRPVQGGAYAQLLTARKKAMNENLMCFAPVRNVGMKRLTDKEVTATGEGFTRHSRRNSGKALRTLACVSDYESMSEEDKNRHSVHVTIHSTWGHLLKPASLRRIEAKVAETNARLAIAQALQAFSG